MKISLSWLNDYLKTDLSAEQIASLLTGCGLEVESIEEFESVRGGLKGIVIGEVREKQKHPNADKLSLTKVDVGGPELLSIVCGAPNVEAGQKVVVATVGAILYPTTGEPFEIKKSKIRGENSEGMICAEDEIGLGESHAGIMVLEESAQVGMSAAEYFGVIQDQVLEIGLTPNRSDAASHFGVARDLAAVIWAQDLQKDAHAGFNSVSFPAVAEVTEELPACPVSITVEDPAACRRYSGILLDDVKVGPSPEWLQNRLKAIGLRPINNVVDVTNYVMHECGQPLHAFDADKIGGSQVHVRKTTEGTRFVTLDGTERKLSSDDLMICDSSKPMCIAGVFGGLDSGVSDSTKKVFLESAAFDSVHVRKTSKRHALKTDSSFRFERGSDPEITVKALLRAAYLLEDIGAARIASQISDVYPSKIESCEVAFSFDYCDQIIGKSIDRNIIRKIITALGMEIVSDGKDALLISVPPYKVDVTRPADVVEEVLRVYGYNNIGFPEKIQINASAVPRPDPEAVKQRIAALLSSRGFREILNNSLTRSSYYEEDATGSLGTTVQLLNPLSSDLGVMRKTLLYGGLESIAYNQNRKNGDLRFFEFGKIYFGKQEVKEGAWPWEEKEQLLMLMTGKREPESWTGSKEKVSFHDIRMETDRMMSVLGLSNIKWTSAEDSLFAEGLEGISGKLSLVRVGVVSKAQLKKTEAEGPVYAAIWDWDNVMKAVAAKKAIRFTEVPKFPAVRRDLALVLDSAVKYSAVEDIAWNTERKLLREVNLFDVYVGDKLGEGKKSYAVSFILQDEEATLTDKQIDKVMEKLTKAYSEQLGASLRN